MTEIKLMPKEFFKRIEHVSELAERNGKLNFLEQLGHLIDEFDNRTHVIVENDYEFEKEQWADGDLSYVFIQDHRDIESFIDNTFDDFKREISSELSDAIENLNIDERELIRLITMILESYVKQDNIVMDTFDFLEFQYEERSSPFFSLPTNCFKSFQIGELQFQIEASSILWKPIVVDGLKLELNKDDVTPTLHVDLERFAVDKADESLIKDFITAMGNGQYGLNLIKLFVSRYCSLFEEIKETIIQNMIFSDDDIVGSSFLVYYNADYDVACAVLSSDAEEFLLEELEKSVGKYKKMEYEKIKAEAKNTVFKIDKDEYKWLRDDHSGFCLNCNDFTVGGCEPDAEGYHCENCEKDAVIGMELALIAGYIEIDDEE